uniref:Sushi domain-containing protein n=1 Tax=Loxodonta africana TaxID=9785 RepID=G3ULR3_LOXAF
MGTPNMLFLINVLLTLWMSCAEGQGKEPCNFPEIKHGKTYGENQPKQTFPVAMGKYLYYTCDHSCVSALQSLWTRITCTEEGWSPIPKCRIIFRVFRTVLFSFGGNGHSSSSGQIDLKILCDTGYKLANDQSSITCTEDDWSSPPKCSSAVHPSGPDCPKLPTFANAILKDPEKQSYRSGEQVEHECEKDFQLDGPHTVKCIKSRWIGSPTCRDSEGKCGFPPPFENGDITSFPLPMYAQGSTVEYQCQASHELQGDKITCRNGQWSEPQKCLDACVISEDMMEKNMQLRWKYDKKNYLKTGDTFEFTCKRGYKEKMPRSIPAVKNHTLVKMCLYNQHTYIS